MLEDGGNVVDAAIATSAMLCVTQNNLCGLGGDFFALIKLGSLIQGLNGSGGASENASISLYEKKRLPSIPERGPLSAITVPGLVDSWAKLASRFGTIELSKLLQPAIRAAGEGFVPGPRYISSISGSSHTLGEFRGWASLFYRSDSPPPDGALFKQKDLARTLDAIAQEGPRIFYEGWLAEKIVKGIAEQGGVLSENDFSKHTSFWSDPLMSTYRGLKIYETAPNSQGATVLLWLNMLEETDIARQMNYESTRFLDLYLRTCLKAYRERANSICDPKSQKIPSDFLTKKFAKEVLSSGALPGASEKMVRPDKGDTTYFCVAITDGDCVSAIQSNYMGFGSGIVPDGTGLVLQNRGCYFSLDPSHHNSLAPGKRTFHTLCASIAEKENSEPAFCLGSMGGDVQPQVQVQLITQIVDYDTQVQVAIDNPRRIVPCTIYESPSEVILEPGFDVEAKSAERVAHALNLRVRRLRDRTSRAGHAQALVFRENALEGGADPRGEGLVCGF